MIMIMPPGHHAPRPDRLRFGTRERWIVGSVAALAVALVIAVIVSFGSTTPKSGHGCVSIALAYSTGGAQIYKCGAGARALCAGVNTPGGLTGQPAQQLAVQCRIAGVPVG
jgi:hypothetical protein